MTLQYFYVFPRVGTSSWARSRFRRSIFKEEERLVRIVQHLNAEREAGFFVTKVIVPLGLIVFMAATVFWVDPENIGPQLGTSTASVLTLIAFQFSLVRMLPPVSYLTRIDLFVLGAMILVFMTLAEAIYTSRITKDGRPRESCLRDTVRPTRGVYARPLTVY